MHKTCQAVRRHGASAFGRGMLRFAHPNCVEEMEPDYEEGMELWRGGEPEDARDALRYALEGCGDNLWVHVALGHIALREFNDPSLARGHFGYAFDLVARRFRRILREDSDRPPTEPADYDAIDGLSRVTRR